MEITRVAYGKYLLCSSVSDEPREFWDSNTGSHFIFTNTGGRRWEALASWKRPVSVSSSEMFLWTVVFFPLKGKQHGNMSSSLFLMAQSNPGSLSHTSQ